MRHLILKSPLWIAAWGLLVQCGQTPDFAPGGAATTIPATFSAVQTQILIPKCGMCHSTTEAHGGVTISSYAELMSSPGAVTPYSPAASQLYKQTYWRKMPLEEDLETPGEPLEPEQMQALYYWIVNGALNN